MGRVPNAPCPLHSLQLEMYIYVVFSDNSLGGATYDGVLHVRCDVSFYPHQYDHQSVCLNLIWI